MQELKGIDTLHFKVIVQRHNTIRKETSTFLKEMSERSICFATWNFHESDHGNGVPDGVRGSLKRTKNALVVHVHYITDAATNISGIQEQGTSVYLYEVAEDRSPSIKFK